MPSTHLSTEAVHYFNRYTEQVETERIYGEAWLRWIYGNPLGKLALHSLVKRALFSRWYGWRMNSQRSRDKIRPFIERYDIDEAEFQDPASSFQSFNDFFYRKLKPEARKPSPSPSAVLFPADGRHMGFQDLSATQGFYIKGQRFQLSELLGDAALASEYTAGSMIISRLCPVDYHRYHFPVSGTGSPPRLIDGPLYSVNPIALRQNIHILSQNRRWLTSIEVPGRGRVLMLEVGATNVGSAISTFRPGTFVRAGDEKGYFQFGGSLTLCLFPPGVLRLDEDLKHHSSAGMELYARMGDHLGHWA